MLLPTKNKKMERGPFLNFIDCIVDDKKIIELNRFHRRAGKKCKVCKDCKNIVNCKKCKECESCSALTERVRWHKITLADSREPEEREDYNEEEERQRKEKKDEDKIIYSPFLTDCKKRIAMYEIRKKRVERMLKKYKIEEETYKAKKLKAKRWAQEIQKEENRRKKLRQKKTYDILKKDLNEAIKKSKIHDSDETDGSEDSKSSEDEESKGSELKENCENDDCTSIIDEIMHEFVNQSSDSDED